MATRSRRARLFRREGDDQDDADLTEEEHAWWAAREEVAGVPVGRRVDDEAPEEPADPHFADYWTAESLFDGTSPGGRGHATDDHGAGAATDEEPGLDDNVMDLDAAHLVLQVEVGAAWEDVTRAHRRLAKLYHPDRLLELSPEAQDLGHDRMAEVNHAYATLRTLHFT